MGFSITNKVLLLAVFTFLFVSASSEPPQRNTRLPLQDGLKKTHSNFKSSSKSPKNKTSKSPTAYEDTELATVKIERKRKDQNQNPKQQLTKTPSQPILRRRRRRSGLRIRRPPCKVPENDHPRYQEDLVLLQSLLLQSQQGNHKRIQALRRQRIRPNGGHRHILCLHNHLFVISLPPLQPDQSLLLSPEASHLRPGLPLHLLLHPLLVFADHGARALAVFLRYIAVHLRLAAGAADPRIRVLPPLALDVSGARVFHRDRAALEVIGPGPDFSGLRCWASLLYDGVP